LLRDEDKAGLNMIVTLEAFVLTFGALIAFAGLVLLFLRKEQSQNKIKLFGQEFEISTPALVVFLTGCAVFVMPLVAPIKNLGRAIVTIGIPTDVHKNGPLNGPPLPNSPSPQAKAQTIFEGVVANVTRFEKNDDLVTLELTLQNTTPDTVSFCVEPTKAKLIDEGTGNSWYQRHSGGKVSCFQKGNLASGKSHIAWMKFKIDDPEPKSCTLALPILLRGTLENLVFEKRS
jgi:hypothetical protein